MTEKPLGIKAYGHIQHLPGSRMGPGDHKATDGQARICLEATRDRFDVVSVTEKLDGSCVAVARIGDCIYPLGRAGYTAASSPYEQHRLFSLWAFGNFERFLLALQDGERIVGEWLAQAHGTRYELQHEPFVAFDIMQGHDRLPYETFLRRVHKGDFITPHLLHLGAAIGIEAVLKRLGRNGFHGAVDKAEGAVWRVEHKGEVLFLAKYVRPEKVDGIFLPEVSGNEGVWNWHPHKQ